MFGKKKDQGQIRSAGYQDEVILDEYGRVVPDPDDMEGVVRAIMGEAYQRFAEALGDSSSVRQRRRRKTMDDDVFSAMVGG